MRLSHAFAAVAMAALAGGIASADQMSTASPHPGAMHSSMKSTHMKSSAMHGSMKSTHMKSEHMASPKPSAKP